MESVFDSHSYRSYLNLCLGGTQSRTGLKKKAAAALQVHTSLISQILGGNCGISLEQAEKMSKFLGHSQEESEYFLLLVLKERAGTPGLRQHFERQLKAIKSKRLTLHERVRKEKVISEADQEKFYSSYLNAAIHVLVSIPGLRARQELAQALGVPRKRINEAVDFLLGIGVLQEKEDELHPGSRHIHLGSDSRHLSRHHLNWRLRTIERLQDAREEDLHYSALVSLSEADVERIKESLLGNLDQNVEIITKSKEETAFVYCFDFFRLPMDAS